MLHEEINFANEWNESDQTLLVEEKTLHVHRCLLSLWSPVFDRMFNSEFIEKNTKSVTLHGKHYDEIKEMLHVMYDRRKEVTVDNVSFLLKLSDEYQMEQLRTECVKHIKAANIHGVQAIKYYSLIRQFAIKEMEEECINEILTMSDSILTNSNEYTQLDDRSKLEIILKRSQYLEQKLERYKEVLKPFVGYIYNRAYDGFEDYLRNEGLNQGFFKRCQKEDEHKTQLFGQLFDYTCQLCRRRVATSKKFNVQTKEICEEMEKLYELIND